MTKAAMKWAVTVLMAAALVAGGATPSSNIPIGQMPTATAVQGGAYLPIIQPRSGQTTNDNYKAQVDTLFTGRNAISVTNLYVTNLFVENLTIITNGTVTGDVWTQFPEFVAPTASSNNFHLTTNGAMLSGISVGPWWNPDTDDVLIGVHDVAQGDSSAAKVYVAAVDDAASPAGYASVRLQVTSGATASGQINLASTQGADTSRFTVNVQPDAAVSNVQLYNKGVLNFAVNDVSGYSGTGTNFLADDGSYKPGTGTRINPTDNFLPYRLDAATFDDSPMYRVDAQTVGVDTIDANVISATNLQSGGVVYSRADGILTNVPSGTGLLYNDGSNTNLTWIDASGIGMWTNRAGVLEPIDLTLPVGWTNQLILGPGTTNVVKRSGSDLVYTNGAVSPTFNIYNGSGALARFGFGSSGTIAQAEGAQGVALAWGGSYQLDLGGSASTTNITGNVPLNLGTVGKPFYNMEMLGTERVYGFDDLGGANYSRLAVSHTGTNGAVVLDSQSSGTAGPSRPILLTLSNFVPPVGMNRTNELLRMTLNGTNRYLFMADQAASGADGLRVYGDNGTSYVQFGAKSDGVDAHVTAGSGGSVWVGASSGSVSYSFSTGGLLPGSSGKTLGSINNPWADYQADGSIYVYGHRSGTGITNYSRLVINHTGTNGAAVFDSQSAGTAGSVPRMFDFKSAPVAIGGMPLGFLTGMPAVPRQADCYYTNIYKESIAAGATTFLTVPAGMRFLTQQIFVTPETNATLCYMAVKASAITYQIRASSSPTTNSTTLTVGNFVFEQGEEVIVNASGPLYHAVVCGLLFTNTIPLKSPRVLSLSNGDNTIYTVPANKHAVPYTYSYFNGSVGAVTRTYYVVPSGSSVGLTTRIGVTSAASGADSGIGSVVTALQTGDSVVVNVNSGAAGQFSYITVFETD